MVVSEAAREELAWWAEQAPGLLKSRTWSWFSLAHTKLYADRGLEAMPHYSVHGDASDWGIGLRLASGQLVSEPLPPELPPTSPSVSRELYALCRLIERDIFPPGAVVRAVSDSTGAVRTALGATVTPATAPWARRLFLAALERHVTVQVEWAPRALLSDVDAASRWDAVDSCHARLPLHVVRDLVRRAFGDSADIDYELFTAVHNRIAPDARFASQFPMPSSAGDGLCPGLWRKARCGWAYPPFALVRPVLRLAVTLRPRVILVLPDAPIVAATLRGWLRVPLGHPLAPPTFNRHLVSCPPIAAFLPPPQGDSTAR